MNSSIFGALSLFLIYVLHPLFISLLQGLSIMAIPGIAVSLTLVFCIDLFVSVRNTLDFNREMGKLSDLTDKIEKKRDELKVSMDAFPHMRLQRKDKLSLHDRLLSCRWKR